MSEETVMSWNFEIDKDLSVKNISKNLMGFYQIECDICYSDSEEFSDKSDLDAAKTLYDEGWYYDINTEEIYCPKCNGKRIKDWPLDQIIEYLNTNLNIHNIDFSIRKKSELKDILLILNNIKTRLLDDNYNYSLEEKLLVILLASNSPDLVFIIKNQFYINPNHHFWRNISWLIENENIKED